MLKGSRITISQGLQFSTPQDVMTVPLTASTQKAQIMAL